MGAINFMLDQIKKSLDDCKPYVVNGVSVRSVVTASDIPGVGCDHVFIPAHLLLAPHLHENSETYILISSGKGRAKIGDRDIDVQKGDIIHIPGGVYHSFYTQDESMELISIQSPPILDDDGHADYIWMSD
jgi:mannose-6-phosphate isomerase-like protein (cupin superfamily)